MSRTTSIIAALITAAAASVLASKPCARAAANTGSSLPRVFCLNPAILAANKARLAKNPGALKPAFDSLIAGADRDLGVKPESVMDKVKVPPGGDKHDYISLAPYFWPNPATKDGLPYIRHDGQHNPDADKPENSDARRFGHVISIAQSLSLAYYFTGEEAYATHAAELLRVWFLDPATRMNPNLNYGQAVLGVNDGRGTGIIETARLADVVDTAGLLAGSRAWTPADETGLTEWMGRYLDWLQTSKNGKDEARAANNHGVWYDVQIVSLALFTGRDALAKRTLEDAKTTRIARQIEPDGKMPLELARTRALGYSVYNLTAFERLANLGDRAGVDLWDFRTIDGRGLRKAVDFIAPYADSSKPWPYKQISKDDRTAILPVLEEADSHYHDPLYRAALTAAGRESGAERFHLLVAAGP